MLHTFQLHSELDESHKRYANEVHGVKMKEVPRFVKDSFEAMTVKVNEGEYTSWVHVIVDVPLLLRRGIIRDEDYEEVENAIKAMFSFVFGDATLFEEHYLYRIDYRLDKVVESEKIRLLYNNLFKKTCRKNGRFEKVIGKEENGKFRRYDDSMYHKHQSVEMILYDKQAERHAKGEVVEEWEKNIMRFEFRLKKAHLKNRQSRKKNPTPRKIKHYFKVELFDEYFEKYLAKNFIRGNFYSLEKAEEIINTTKLVRLTPTMKARLKDFLKRVSTHDMTVPKNEMSAATFRSRLKYFDAMNMHPVTIPQSKLHIASYLPDLFDR